MELRRGVQGRFVFDVEFNITEWDESLERMFGWTAEEAIGRPMYQIVPGDGNRAARIRALRDGGGWDGVVVVTRKDGSSVAIVTHTEAIRAPRSGEIVGYEGAVSSIPDTTDRLDELETEVERLRALLERQLQTGESLEFEGAIGVDDEPFVAVRWGQMAGQLTTQEAYAHGLRMCKVASAAASDAFVMRSLEEMGMGDIAVGVLEAIREKRGDEEGNE